MKSVIFKMLKGTWLSTATFVLGLVISAGVLHAEPTVPVENYTSFSDKELSEYLTKNLRNEIKEEIAKLNLVIFAKTALFTTKPRTCFAMLGFTGATEKGLNTRIPGYSFYRMSAETDSSKSNCTAEVLSAAIEDFNAAKMSVLLESLDYSVSSGGTRNILKPKSDFVSLYSEGLTKSEASPLYSVMLKHKFNDVFDYRYVQGTVLTTAVKLPNGKFMCVAFAGVTANSPDNRNPRWPQYHASNVRLQENGTIEKCKQIVAEVALSTVLSSEWNEKGILGKFARTQEEGIPLPKPQKVKPKQTHLVSTTSSTRQTNVLKCTNDCYNGNCIRKFSNGNTERWQAPRKMNPFTNNWEWDTATNACGM